MPAAVLRAQGEPGGQREALQGEKSRDGGRDGRKRFWRGEQPLRAEVGYGGEQLPGGGPQLLQEVAVSGWGCGGVLGGLHSSHCCSCICTPSDC